MAFKLEFCEDTLVLQLKHVCSELNTQPCNIGYLIMGNSSLHVLSTLQSAGLGMFIVTSEAELELLNHLGWGNMTRFTKAENVVGHQIVSTCTRAVVTLVNRKQIKGIKVAHVNAGLFQFFFCPKITYEVPKGADVVCGPTCFFQDIHWGKVNLSGISNFEVSGVGYLCDEPAVRFNGKQLPSTFSKQSGALLKSYDNFINHTLCRANFSAVKGAILTPTICSVEQVLEMMEFVAYEELGNHNELDYCLVHRTGLNEIEGRIFVWKFEDLDQSINLAIYFTGKIRGFAKYRHASHS